MTEVLRKLKKSYLLIPHPNSFPPDLRFPKLWAIHKRKIIVLNDFHLYYETDHNANNLIDNAVSNGYQIIANCRTIHEWKVMSLELGDVRQNNFEKIEIPKMDKDTAEIVARLNNKKVPTNFDGNVGKIVEDFNALVFKYNNLPKYQQEILIGIKELYAIGKRNEGNLISLSDIKKICEQRNLTMEDKDWITNIQELIELNFLSSWHNL